jgi:hypothetical protein
MAGFGTKRAKSHVSYSVALGVKADVSKALQLGATRLAVRLGTDTYVLARLASLLSVARERTSVLR